MPNLGGRQVRSTTISAAADPSQHAITIVPKADKAESPIAAPLKARLMDSVLYKSRKRLGTAGKW